MRSHLTTQIFLNHHAVGCGRGSLRVLGRSGKSYLLLNKARCNRLKQFFVCNGVVLQVMDDSITQQIIFFFVDTGLYG